MNEENKEDIYKSKNITFKGSSLAVRLIEKFVGTQGNKSTNSKANEIIESIGIQLLLAKSEISEIVSRELLHQLSNAVFISKYDTLISAKDHIISAIKSYNLISSDIISESTINTIYNLTEFQCYALLVLCNEMSLQEK